jgi:hypothetical protein
MVFDFLIAFCSIFELRAVRQLSITSHVSYQRMWWKVFTRKKKIRSASGAVKPGNLLLRLFRSDAGLQAPLTSSQIAHQTDAYDMVQKGIGAVMLEVEYRKAEAGMTMERNRKFC